MRGAKGAAVTHTRSAGLKAGVLETNGVESLCRSARSL